jgi:hypothetical protein
MVFLHSPAAEKLVVQRPHALRSFVRFEQTYLPKARHPENMIERRLSPLRIHPPAIVRNNT